ncbi:MAG: hypothetical protein HC902_06250 [Calothrix sp. SM1_5_4]|nr:hypothetical protein [Calothrix sp. SM1_5_4]
MLPLFLGFGAHAHAGLCLEWGEAVKAGALARSPINEASGMSASALDPNRLYWINDSGDAGRFYISDLKGGAVRAIQVSGFSPRDTEALAYGPCPGEDGNCLYIADIGDNLKRRTNIDVIVIREEKKISRRSDATKEN